jgi:hypothetical protein
MNVIHKIESKIQQILKSSTDDDKQIKGRKEEEIAMLLMILQPKSFSARRLKYLF